MIDNKQINFTPLMPDGSPCPSVLLEEDLIRFLRLEELGVKNPQGTLAYYREIGKLHGTYLAKHLVYTRESALQLLETLTKKS